MEWNPQFELVEQYLTSTSVSVFLTGKAGTGKTTFLKHIIATLPKRMAVVAPTGVAAINAGGVTIHSFFQLPPCAYLPDVKEVINEYSLGQNKRKMRKNRLDVIRTLDLLIIDEISMVRADLMDAIDDVMRRIRHSGRPFGGVQLLMIGDLWQLPPVVRESERKYMDQVYASPFFFSSKVLQTMPFVTIQLQTIYRQQDERFVSLLNNIRNNQFDNATLNSLNQRYMSVIGKEYDDYIRLTTHNYQSDNINNDHFNALPSPSVRMEAKVIDNFPESMMPVASSMELKVGEQVMFVKNDSQSHRYYNGMIAKIKAFVRDDDDEYYTHVRVLPADGTDTIDVECAEWENVKYEVNPQSKEIERKVEGRFIQFPFRPAWAITIHKAQGLTFDHVIIDVAQAFSPGQVYVALSRCRSYEGLILSSHIHQNGAISNMPVLQFDETRESEDTVRDNLTQFQWNYTVDIAGELFGVGTLEHLTNELRDLFLGPLDKVYRKAVTDFDNAYSVLESLEDVVMRFKKQLLRMMQTHGTTQRQLSERMSKAASYFADKFDEYYKLVKPYDGLNIDNKDTRSRVEENMNEIMQIMAVRKACYEEIAANGFDSAKYYGIKSQALLRYDDQRLEEKRASQSSYDADDYDDYDDDVEDLIVKNIDKSKIKALLYAWRSKLSKEEGLLPSRILTQKSLTAIIDTLPRTLKDLAAIPGIGKVKLKQYGKDLLTLMKRASED